MRHHYPFPQLVRIPTTSLDWKLCVCFFIIIIIIIRGAPTFRCISLDRFCSPPCCSSLSYLAFGLSCEEQAKQTSYLIRLLSIGWCSHNHKEKSAFQWVFQCFLRIGFATAPAHSHKSSESTQQSQQENYGQSFRSGVGAMICLTKETWDIMHEMKCDVHYIAFSANRGFCLRLSPKLFDDSSQNLVSKSGDQAACLGRDCSNLYCSM